MGLSYVELSETNITVNTASMLLFLARCFTLPGFIDKLEMQ